MTYGGGLKQQKIDWARTMRRSLSGLSNSAEVRMRSILYSVARRSANVRSPIGGMMKEYNCLDGLVFDLLTKSREKRA